MCAILCAAEQGAKELAVLRQVARPWRQVHAGHQGGGGAAVGQDHGFSHEPHDVAGELGHLRRTQGNAGAQRLGLGKGGGSGHERLVLCLVIPVVAQEAKAGEGSDLFTDEALLVEAVTQAFLGGSRVQAQGLQQVVGAEPLAVVGKAGVGLDHEPGRAVGLDAEEAADRQQDAGRSGNGGMLLNAADV